MAEIAQQDLLRIREKLELLTAERGDATKTKSAVRRGELQVLASLKMQSDQIAAAPTQAQYNALQSDVAAIFEALKKISNIHGDTSLPKAL